MKIMLLTTPLHPKLQSIRFWGAPPLGLYVVGSILRNNGYDEINFCDELTLETYYNEDGWDENQIQRLLGGFDIVGISANSFNWGMARELIQVIKKWHDPPFVMCGGVHPTYFDEHILNTTRADLIVRGDAEKNILRIVEAIKNKKTFHDIPGISFRNGDQIIRNPVEVEKNLIDTTISCYREMLEKVYHSLPLETSRGCRYDCAFCSVPHRKNWRGLDVETVTRKIDHALHFIDKVKMKDINFVDDYFCADLQRATAILKWIEASHKDFQVSYEVRCNDFLNKEIDLAAAISDKTSEFHMGIDSGYDEGLRKIRKGFNLKQVEESLSKLQSYSLEKKIAVSIIVGFPWEDISDCLKTIDFANSIRDRYRIENLHIFWWMPMVSSIWYKQDEYGFRINESHCDDPTWLAGKEFIYSVHPKLSLADFEIIDLQTTNPMGNLIERKDGIKGFEF